MKSTLLAKVILNYILFLSIGFIILCTFTQHSLNAYTENREAQRLYREATQVAGNYARNYFNSELSLQDFQTQMESLGQYLSAEIWSVDNQGDIRLDSSDASIGKNAANA